METVAIRFQIQILESDKNIILISKKFVFLHELCALHDPRFLRASEANGVSIFFMEQKRITLSSACMPDDSFLTTVIPPKRLITIYCFSLLSHLTPPLPFDTLVLSY